MPLPLGSGSFYNSGSPLRADGATIQSVAKLETPELGSSQLLDHRRASAGYRHDFFARVESLPRQARS